MRTGDEKSARTALERSWDLDKSAVVTKNLLDVLDKIDKFEVRDVGRLRLQVRDRGGGRAPRLCVAAGGRSLQDVLGALRLHAERADADRDLPVHDDFAVRTLGLPGLVGALGACFGRVVTMDSPRARPPGEFSWQATLWHEIAHVFYAADVGLPRAALAHRRHLGATKSTGGSPAWGRELTLEFARQLSEGQDVRREEACRTPSSGPRVCHWRTSRRRSSSSTWSSSTAIAGLRTLLLAYADGATDAAAFTKAFGQERGRDRCVVQEVRGSALRRPQPGTREAALGGRSRTTSPGSRPAPSSAPGNFVSQLQLGQILLKTGDTAGATAALQRAAELAPPATGDASPRALLAQIAEKAGDRATARRELRQLLTYNHENVSAARRLVELSADQQAVDDRDFALRAVADLDPFDAEIHGQLGRRLMEKKDIAGAIVEFQAGLAMGPANLAEAHTDFAEALFLTGRKDEAKAQALLALKQAPTFARAQDLLLAVIGR